MGGMQPQRPNLGFGPAPRPLGGGIMGGQPQQPRPFDGGMGGPMQPRPTQPPMQPQQSAAQFNAPRPMGGGIMGGQPPMGRRPY